MSSVQGPTGIPGVEAQDDAMFVSLRLTPILTANLPVAATKMNGIMLLEDTGSSFNLIIYAKGTRQRYTGTTF